MSDVEEDKIKRIGGILLDDTKPLKARFRALFSLKNVPGPLSISYISRGFSDPSALLKHELAYCLGQMRDKSALPLLYEILGDEKQEPIVRHEAAEALGAIGSDEAIAHLERYLDHDVREIAETCNLALDRLKWLRDAENSDQDVPINPFESIDPAPASSETDITKLEETLLDETLPLFDRYRAMFALRNLKTDESTLVLTKGLKSESALFAHEVAFVLGQLQNEVAVPALIECLSDTNKNEMVRHECAEALGAIATQECFDVLKLYLDDKKRVVRESCEVALDMCEYENSPDFQYALT